MKKSPQRMCIVCRNMKDKRQLIRIVRSKEGEISLDLSGKAAGRGAYICCDGDCAKKCKKIRALSRAFECNVDAAIYDRIEEELLGRKAED